MTNPPFPRKPAALFISHGGGPLPVLGDAGHLEMVEHLGEVAAAIDKPAGIVVVSAHWEEADAVVTGHTSPSMIYDYYGFPEASYSLSYPAPGDPGLAARLAESLAANDIPVRVDEERGFDHGLYIPLMLMYPDADIPCVQLSLRSSLDPVEHIRMGEALAGLADDGILVLGSGFSFHNLRALMSRQSTGPDSENEEFEHWLVETCTSAALDETARTDRLVIWAQAPGARYCHPREEHLLPLHVCYGVTKSVCTAHAALTIMGKQSSTFFW